MHQGQNHFPTSISFNGGVKHPICQPLEHQSQLNIMTTLVDCPHNIQRNPIGIITKRGQCGHQHVENDTMHNYTHDLSMFDHPILLIISLWKVTIFIDVVGVICYMYT